MSNRQTSQLDWLLELGDDGKTMARYESNDLFSSSVALCYASQRDSLAYLACFTQWQSTSICCKPCTWLIKAAEQKEKDKDGRANRQYVPLWASFCRRILRRCRAEEEISYVCRSAPANSWHLPNTPSTEKEKRRMVKTGLQGMCCW